MVLRLVALNQSFWLDEAVQVWASAHFSIKDLLTQYMPWDFNPPLYHILLHFWIKVFGASEIGVRSLSVLLGIGCIFLIKKIGDKGYGIKDKEIRDKGYEIKDKRKNLKDLGIGTIAALLLATSPLHIYYSQEARMYILACFLVLLATWRFLIFLERQNWENSFLFGVSLVLMGFSHFLALLTVPVFLLFCYKSLRVNGLTGSRVVKFILPFFLLLCFYLSYSSLLLKQLKTGMGWTKTYPVWGKTVGSFSLKGAALLPVKFIIGRISIENKVIYGIVSVLLVSLFWGLTLKLRVNPPAGGEELRVELRVKNFRKLVYLMLFFPSIVGFLVSFKVPVFSYFRFLFCLPFFYLAVAIGISRVTSRYPVIGQKRLILGVLVAVNLLCSGVYLFNSKFHREDWRGAAEWIEEKNKENSPVIILSQISKPLEYYDKGKSHTLFINGREELGKLDNKEEEIFLVSYSLPIFDPEDKIREKIRDKGYEIKEGESFRKVGVERWEKKI